MNNVQPGSATTNSNSTDDPAACTVTAPRSPATGRSTTTGPSAAPLPVAEPASPSPATRTSTGSSAPSSVTRISCTGASAGPTNSSVDSADITCIPAPYAADVG